MLGPHTGRENALHLKLCLPVSSTRELWERLWELEEAYSSALCSPAQALPVGTPCLLCACSAHTGVVLVTPASLFIYFDHLYIPFI